MRLADEQALPLPAETLLDRARTDWFPEFLSHGQMKPHFQPIVELRTGRAYGREALMRGKLGAIEVRGGELLAAAEAHDALFSFDYRARTAALEVGLPLLPEGEILFVNLDPRAVARRRVARCAPRGRSSAASAPTRRGSASRSSSPSAARTASCSPSMVDAHRKRGALIALDDLSGGTESLACLELLRPDVAQDRHGLTAGIQHSDGPPQAGRRARRAAPTSWARKVVAEGIERVDEYETMVELGVDLGQGFYFGHPAERPMAVDGRLFKRRGELV